MTQLKAGMRVKHDFSKEQGTIKAVVKGDHKYKYFVFWDSLQDGDWYEEKVLVPILNRQKVVDDNHPRFNQVGTYEKQWTIPNSVPDLHCHTVIFDDGVTEQFLSYQIEPAEEA